MVAIVRACADYRYSRVVAVLGTQMGKTDGLLNVMGWCLSDDPIPLLYVGPTQKHAESMSSDRVTKMLKSTPSLWEKLERGKKNKISEKFVGGCRLGFAWAGSATELSSHPVGFVLLDERDRMEAIKGEGDPVELATARVSNYAGTVAVVSSPTLGHIETEVDEHGFERWAVGDEMPSPVWKLWQEGTRFEWAWPCPECGEYFVARFKHLTWPEGSTPQRALREARLACPCCGALIESSAKRAMNERGVFVAPGQRVTPDGDLIGADPENKTASFWVSGLCSPWATFGERAHQYLAALRSGDQTRVQAVVNTGFGELYHGGGDAPEWRAVAELREGYASGTVPAGVLVVTCCVDVQKNRLVYAVRGWGVNFESWLIEAGELWGETEHDAVWLQLSNLLAREFGKLPIAYMLIDSGYKPGDTSRTPDHQVYLFCRRHRGRAFPSKGHDRQDRPYRAAKIDVSFRGQIEKNGLDLWHIDTDWAKSGVHARLKWPTGEPGAWHLPSDATVDYCKQLVAEHRVTAPGGRFSWVRLHRENHWLDVEALNFAAAHIVGVQHLQAPEPKPEPPPAEPRHFLARPPMPRRNWVTNY